MVHARPKPQSATPVAVTLLSDLDIITRIEASLAGRARHCSRRSRPDFSRLARYIHSLKF